MSQGQCLCGSVRFAAAPAYQWLSHCHCSMCRKHYGTLFGTLVGLDPANFRWLAGEADIVHYADSKLPWLAITDGLPHSHRCHRVSGSARSCSAGSRGQIYFPHQ